MKKLVLAFLISVFFFASIRTQAQGYNTLPDSATKKMDSAMNAILVKTKMMGASIAIVNDGQIVYSKGYGFADKNKNVRATGKTCYGIGSTTKTFTAMAIMKLRDEGKIDLEKPASYYVPELTIKSLVETGDILKIKNLLSHTSGLTDGFLNNDACKNYVDFNTVINDLNQTVMVHKANWKFSYSNVGFDLLGVIIEHVTHMKYEDYIRQNFLDKMEMTHSGFYIHPEDSNFSKGYKDNVETAEPVLRDMPAGRLFCSPEDMAHFMQMVMNNGMYKGVQILSAQALKDMETSHVEDTRLYEAPMYGYGMFFKYMHNQEDSIYGTGVGHPGDTYVFHSGCQMFPKVKLGFVLLTNTDKGYMFCSSGFTSLFNIWMKYVKGIKLHPLPATAPDKNKTYGTGLTADDMVGNYATGEDIHIVVRKINENKLIVKQDNQHFILKRQENGSWSFTLRIMYLFKKKIPDFAFAFEKVDGNIYLESIQGKYKRVSYDLVKDNPIPLSQEWKKTVGKYTLLNSCEGNQQGLPEEIFIKGNKLYLKMRFDKKHVENYSFNAVNDTMAAIDGIDRYSGMIMKILPNGHVYFSGYEMVKKGE